MFEAEWQGKQLDKNTTYNFSISFLENNKEVEVKYRSSKNAVVELKFRTKKVTKEGVKVTCYLNEGEGFYQFVANNGNQVIRKYNNLEFIFFITGPRLVFGIDMPAVLLHDLRLQKTVLSNRYAITNQLDY